MKPGSVLVDISIDQGGCFEDSRPTTHDEPTYRVHNSMFYCVANMPGSVPHTSTYALTNVTLPYAVELANRGWRDALRRDPALALGLNTHDGEITYGPVAEAHGLAAPRRRRGPQLTDAAAGDRPDRPRLPRPPERRAGPGARTRSRPTGATCAATSATSAVAEIDSLDGDHRGRRRELPRLAPGRRRRTTRRSPPARRRARWSRSAGSTASPSAKGWSRTTRPPRSRRRRRPGGCRSRSRCGRCSMLLDAAGVGGRAAAAARPGAARGAVRHGRPDLRGGRPRRRRPRPREPLGAAARQGRSRTRRPDHAVDRRSGCAGAPDLDVRRGRRPEPEWALGYRWDIVLTGPRSTPMEAEHDEH